MSVYGVEITKQHPISLDVTVKQTADIYQQTQKIKISTHKQQQIIDFILGRLTAYYHSRGIPTSIINAVMVCNPDRPLDFDNRVMAMHDFSHADEATDLSAANKRISNILKQQSIPIDSKINESLLVEPAEKKLFNLVNEIEQDCIHLFKQGKYSQGLKFLATLRSPIDEYFDQVMVMSEDQGLRQNRLALLNTIHRLFLHVADISLLQN